MQGPPQTHLGTNFLTHAISSSEPRTNIISLDNASGIRNMMMIVYPDRGRHLITAFNSTWIHFYIFIPK